MSWVAAVAASVALTGAVVKGVSEKKARKKANKKLDQLLAENPVRPENKYPAMQLAMANNITNSKVPGIEDYKRQLDSTYGSQISNINKNATDASQALALGAGAGAQRDFASGDTIAAEGDWKKFGLTNLNAAYASMTQEQREKFEDMVRRFNNKAGIWGVQSANNFANAGMWGNAIMSSAQVYAGAGGGASSFGGMGSGGGGGGGGGATGAGVGGAVGAAGGAYSDIRLKENYHIVGKSPSGINIYEFNYKGNPIIYRGVMAGEIDPDAVVEIDGYLYVDYSKIDVEFTQIN